VVEGGIEEKDKGEKEKGAQLEDSREDGQITTSSSSGVRDEDIASLLETTASYEGGDYNNSSSSSSSCRSGPSSQFRHYSTPIPPLEVVYTTVRNRRENSSLQQINEAVFKVVRNFNKKRDHDDKDGDTRSKRIR